ncbi:unnamed protein product [Staurois parvus]|uniref:Uncharacterized protein n=1 Tax=Staurois parvus TaxID=386267 RepID=A0ABN9FTV3_9NEOB|nr:unnamed protein product [Staurois parvus]
MMSGSDILFTTIHVITDWPISDHMIGTSHRRSRTVIGVPLCPEERAQAVNADAVYEQQPAPALLPSARLCT